LRHAVCIVSTMSAGLKATLHEPDQTVTNPSRPGWKRLSSASRSPAPRSRPGSRELLPPPICATPYGVPSLGRGCIRSGPRPLPQPAGPPIGRSPLGGRTRGLAQHSERGECPKADRGQPDERRSHPGSPIPGAWSCPDNGAYAYQPRISTQSQKPPAPAPGSGLGGAAARRHRLAIALASVQVALIPGAGADHLP
jgi:hypothetical protein